MAQFNFYLTLANRSPAPPMTRGLSAFDQSARAWLVGAEFSANLGNSLVTQIERTVHATKGMTPDQLESYGMVEYKNWSGPTAIRSKRSCAPRR